MKAGPDAPAGGTPFLQGVQDAKVQVTTLDQHPLWSPVRGSGQPQAQGHAEPAVVLDGSQWQLQTEVPPPAAAGRG